jgi:hypothetical protein
MLRDAIGGILLLLAAAGCDSGRPFDRPLARMNEGRAAPAPAPPPQAAPAPGAVVPENCQGAAPLGTMLRPVTTGPLRLEAIKCSAAEYVSGLDANLVSPDGATVAMLDNGPDMAVTIRPIAGGEGIRIPAPAAWPRLDGGQGPAALAWSRDSAFLWGVSQPRVRPNGWALAGMRPMRFFPDGRAAALPALIHPAGPLDGLLWAGDDGLALAAFGTRGSFYRPEHEDRAPALAFVDARSGRILDTLPMNRLPRERGIAAQLPYLRVRAAAATLLSDGRLRAVLGSSGWVIWTQGARPRVVRNPYPGEQIRRMMMVFAPGGSSLLVVRRLQPEGGVCIEPRGCSRGRPVEGVLAALHDARTGAARWTIRGRVVVDSDFPMPAISPDGRYALIGLPVGEDLRIALLSMRNGAVLQLLPTQGRGAPSPALGFQSSGRLWLRTGNVTAFYRFGGAR